MNRGPLLLGLGAIAVIGFGALSWLLPRYDDMVAKDEQVRKAWADVETLLQRRYDLIPQLTATVQGNTQQEKEIFLGLAGAYQKYTDADGVNERVGYAQETEGYLSQLMYAGRIHPELQSAPLFGRLMTSLESTEDDIARARMGYNDAARTLNTTVRSWEGGLVSKATGIAEVSYYKPQAHTQERPQVDFAAKGGTAPSRTAETLTQQQMTASNLKFTALLKDGDVVKAMVLAPGGRSLTLQAGDTIEGLNAKVITVDNMGLVVDETIDGKTMRVRITR